MPPSLFCTEERSSQKEEKQDIMEKAMYAVKCRHGVSWLTIRMQIGTKSFQAKIASFSFVGLLLHTHTFGATCLAPSVKGTRSLFSSNPRKTTNSPRVHCSLAV